MIYGQQTLDDGIVVGKSSELKVKRTGHNPSLMTRILARHQGNIVNVAQTLFEPGDLRDEHVNDDVDELLIVLNGELDIVAGTDIITLRAKEGGYIFLPHGVNQGISNNSKEDAILLAVAIRHEDFVHRNQTIFE